ncbi:MAG: DUF4293 domain-containing protein [Alloprevotella sp.]|nr:DUF4293 domain-containing protein [Alloprevotella sp.]
MIQRIQSVYLLLAGILPAFTFTTPLARFSLGEDAFLTLSSLGLRATGTPQPTATQPVYLALALLAVLLMLLSVLNIFGYKNRKRQVRVCNWSVALAVAWYAAYVGICAMFTQQTGTAFTPALCAALPFLTLVFTLLARRSIKKDEELVRAADRIR